MRPSAPSAVSDFFVAERQARLARRQRSLRLRLALRWLWLLCVSALSVSSQSVPLVMVPGKPGKAFTASAFTTRIRARLVALDAVSITKDATAERAWRWIVLDETAWAFEKRRFKVDSPFAFTRLDLRSTWLRGFRLAQMTDRELDIILKHELEHIACGCDLGEKK